MASYNQAEYQPPRPEAYPRQASNASMNRYVPDSYGGPAASQPPPPQTSYDYAPSRPRGPSLGEYQVPSYPPQQNYGPSPGMQAPNNQLHPSAAIFPPQGPPYPQTGVDADGYMQAPNNPRRHSATSTHSQRSHHSHHSHRSGKSHHSHDSRRSQHSRHSDRDVNRDRRSEDERRRSRESRHSREEKDLELKRRNTHRPSWGDSIYGIFGVIKDALGPRDKY